MIEIALNAAGHSPEEIQATLRELFADVHDDVTVRRDAESHGLSLSELERIRPADVTVRSDGGGLGGVGEAILVGIAIDVGKHVVTNIIIPYLQRRIDDRITERREDGSD